MIQEIEKVRNLLLSLGGTAQEVAEALLSHSVKGLRDNQCACPVAIFLKKAGLVQVCVHNSEVTWSDRGACRRGLALPDAVENFIINFDSGGWPELYEETP